MAKLFVFVALFALIAVAVAQQGVRPGQGVRPAAAAGADGKSGDLQTANSFYGGYYGGYGYPGFYGGYYPGFYGGYGYGHGYGYGYPYFG